MRGLFILTLCSVIGGGLGACRASGWTDVPAIAQPPAPMRPSPGEDASAPAPSTDPDSPPPTTDAAPPAPLPPADAASADTRPGGGTTPPPDTRPGSGPSPPDVADATDTASEPCPPAPAAEDVITTFEDGSFTAPAVSGRDANPWYLINNDMGASAVLEVAEGPPRCNSRRFLRFAGINSPTRSPIARVLFRATSASDTFYDARARGYLGVRLTMRAGTPARMRIKLPDRNTASSGGICVACSDHFGKDLDVPATWTTFSIPFAELTQTGVGDRQPAVNAAALFGIELVVRLAVFELDVDDVSFYR
jgi:hypothetical protein